MLKAVIVDDEPIIRLGVRASIQWEALALAFAGEYANGAEAMRALEREPADVLITDIKMPVMDGLELTKQVRARWPATKVVLISSYNDFEFVRQGIVLGASDYIMKPTMEPEELNEVLGRCIAAIRRERDVQDKLAEYDSDAGERSRRRLETDAKRLFALEREDAKAGARLAERFPGGYAAVRVALDGAEELHQRCGHLYVSIALGELQERFYALHEAGVAFAAQEAELVLLLPRPAGDAAEAMRRLRLELIPAAAGASLTLGYAESERPGGWRQHYSWTGRLYSRRFFDGAGGVYDCRPEAAEAGGEVGAIAAAAGEATGGAHDEAYGEGGEVEGGWADAWNGEAPHHSPPPSPSPLAEPALRLPERAARWRSMRYDMRRVKREACENFSALFVRRMDPALLMAHYRLFMKTETLEELLRTFEASVREAEVRQPDEERLPGGGAGLAAQAMAFIHERFDRELTLQMVADHVHVSKNYFSVLFKKQTDQNFIDYIIQLRIEKAKELLGNKAVKIYEVAELSGFNDVKYFSKLFKKMVGVTPAEYREGHG